MEYSKELFKRNIRFIREKSRLSQAEFGEIVGISQHMVSIYENGDNPNPTLDILIRLSNYSNISIEDLLTLELDTYGMRKPSNGYDDQQKIEEIIMQIKREGKEGIAKPTVFISYNWGSELTADEVEKRLKPIATILRDKSSIKPWGSITEFMKRIRETDLLVVIVSDKYLKSVNCLYEVMQLLKDNSWNTHSMFLVEDSAKGIYKAIGQLEYIKYWNDEANNLELALKDMSPAQITNQAEELKKIKLIQLNINDFIRSVSDSNNPELSKAIDAVVDRVNAR